MRPCPVEVWSGIAVGVDNRADDSVVADLAVCGGVGLWVLPQRWTRHPAARRPDPALVAPQSLIGISHAPQRCMAETRREQKMLKKDQRGARDIRDEVGERIRDGADSQPIIRNPNRDRARGDWDRTGDHHDEEA